MPRRFHRLQKDVPSEVVSKKVVRLADTLLVRSPDSFFARCSAAKRTDCTVARASHCSPIRRCVRDRTSGARSTARHSLVARLRPAVQPRDARFPRPRPHARRRVPGLKFLTHPSCYHAGAAHPAARCQARAECFSRVSAPPHLLGAIPKRNAGTRSANPSGSGASTVARMRLPRPSCSATTEFRPAAWPSILWRTVSPSIRTRCSAGSLRMRRRWRLKRLS